MRCEGLLHNRPAPPACRSALGKLYLDGPVLIPDWLTAGYWFDQAAQQGDAAAQYEPGKLLLSNDPEVRDPALGLQWLERAAHRRNGHTAYRLGKEYLKGEIVAKDTARAMDYLTQSAEAGNQYAQFFLDLWDSLQPPSVMLAAIRLLYHMSRVFQAQTPSLPISGGIHVDRKLMARIREKKIAAGHKPDDHEEQVQDPTMSM